MAKKQAKAEKQKSKPRFEAGLIITARSLIVDNNNVAWWVDPDAGTIKLAQ